MKIHVTETMRSLLYLPFYLAQARGEWQRVGLEVAMGIAADAASAPQSVLRGEADIYIGGPARVMMNHAEDQACPLICFGQIVARNPFVLIGAKPRHDFTLGDLMSLHVGIANEAPTPRLMLHHELREAGLEPARLIPAAPAPMAESIRRLKLGLVDVIQVMEPYTDHALRQGNGHLWYRGADAADIAFSSLVTTTDFAAKNTDLCGAVMRVLARSQTQLFDLSAAQIAREIAPFFAQPEFGNLDHGQLTRAITRYTDMGVWARRPCLSQQAYRRMGDIMVSGGAIPSYPPFEHMVRNGFLPEGRIFGQVV